MITSVELKNGNQLNADNCEEWYSNNKINLAKLSISFVFQQIISHWRDDVMEDSCWPMKIVALFASEIAFAINIPLALIEFVVRGVFALFLLPLKCCCKNDPYLLKFRCGIGAQVSLYAAGHCLKHLFINFNIENRCKTPWHELVKRCPELDVSTPKTRDSA